jgi:glutamyl-tRNA synthetase
MSVTVSEGGGKLSKRDRAKALLLAIKQRKGTVDLDSLAAAGEITRAELDAFMAGESTPDGPNITAMAEALGVALPEINVVDFFHSGYLPEAMVNFIALLGWSPGREGSEVMTRQELIDSFDVRRLNKTNSLFDRQKLVSFNMEHYRRLVQEDLPRLRGHFRQFLKAKDSPLAKLGEATLDRLLVINEGARTLAQVEEKCGFLAVADDGYEYDEKAVKKVLGKEDAPELLGAIREILIQVEWTAAGIHQAIEQLCASREVGMGQVAQPLRVAVTGSTISPPIGDSLELLGRERTLARIDRTLAILA